MQQFYDHADVKTTEIYAHITENNISVFQTPLMFWPIVNLPC